MAEIAGMAGEIRVNLREDAGRISSVAITSTRPRQAARIFEGRSPEEMCGTIGRVFSLCGTAQTVAALTAVEAALGIAPSAAVTAARNAARRAEYLTQITSRLALHWPRVLGLPMAPQAVRAAMAVERAISASALGADWRRPGAGAIGQGGAALAPEIDAAVLVDPLAQALKRRGLEGYGALPEGTSPEYGVFSDLWDADRAVQARAVHGPGLAARLTAAEVALRTLPDAIRADLAAAAAAAPRAPQRCSGAGEAVVNTARGPLTHRVEIEDKIVIRCRTAAPTEPNFTEHGPVGAGLRGAAADPVAAELHVLAIDPCVACRVALAPG